MSKDCNSAIVIYDSRVVIYDLRGFMIYNAPHI